MAVELLIQPAFQLSPELSNPANLVLPAQDFAPPPIDNVTPIPNLISGSNIGWNWEQYYDLSPTNSIPTVATQPAIADQLTTPSADSTTIPGLVNNAPLAASANNPVATPGDVMLGPPESLSPAASNTIQSNSLLIAAAVAAGLYLFNS
jgi:hypothetical protein